MKLFRSYEEVIELLRCGAIGVFNGTVNFYVDGGDLSGRKPSRLIRIADNGDIEELRA